MSCHSSSHCEGIACAAKIAVLSHVSISESQPSYMRGAWGPSQYEIWFYQKLRSFCDRLIFNMGIPIPGKDGLYIETGTCSQVIDITTMIYWDLWPKYVLSAKHFCEYEIRWVFIIVLHAYREHSLNMNSLWSYTHSLLSSEETTKACDEFVSF